MSNSSELGNNQKLDKYILNNSSSILEQLEKYVANKNNLFGLFVFGSPQDWGVNLEPYKLLGVGIVYLITMLFSFFTELMSRNIVIYQHCLLILQEALIIAEEREKNNKLTSIKNINEKYEYLLQEFKNITKEINTKEKKSSINKNIKGKNLFQELKKIKLIDAPKDGSTNFDSYLNREESAGTDIH